MFMVLMFTLLPLYYSDNYYNILNDKRDIYWLFSRILFVVIAVSLCISLMLVIKNHQFSKNKRTQLRKISALDVVMLLFGILAIVSTVYSADIGNSISGENAWDVGTQMIVCSVIVILSFPDATAEREISGYICISGPPQCLQSAS